MATSREDESRGKQHLGIKQKADTLMEEFIKGQTPVWEWDIEVSIGTTLSIRDLRPKIRIRNKNTESCLILEPEPLIQIP